MTNLSDVLPTLKRFDSDVEEVLASSGHVAMYTMVVESSQWTRRNVEGSLFILKRKSNPRFRLMVLNKLSTENYFEDIHAGLAFEKNPPYLMYTHGNAEIIGVWFYEQDDLSRVEEVLERIKHLQQAQDEQAQAAGHAAQAATPQTHTSTSAASRPAPATPPKPAGPPAGKGDDDAFWDKPAPAGAQQAAAARAAAATGTAPAAQPAPTGDAAANNLANLLRNATLKAQVPQAAAPNAPAGPLPPSFFAQQQQPGRPQASPVPPPAPQAPPHVMHGQAVHAPQPSPAPPHIAPSPHAPQPQPPAQQMGGALAKLFANAHKAPTPASPAAPQQPPMAAPPHTHAAPPSVAAVHYAAAPVAAPAAVANGVSDEEKVRRLLARIATNEGLLKMLAGEMRAVGLL